MSTTCSGVLLRAARAPAAGTRTQTRAFASFRLLSIRQGARGASARANDRSRCLPWPYCIRTALPQFVVSHSGRIKCSTADIAEAQNLSAPLPHAQKVVFDPAQHLERATWPRYDFENMKSAGNG